VSSWPSRDVPETAGAAVVDGSDGAIVAVRPDRACVVPSGFVAVTRVRNVEPTSALASVSVVLVAARSTQSTPNGAQRCQRRVVAIVGVPVQVPSAAVRIWPSTGEPLIDGFVLFSGGTLGPTVAEAADDAVAEDLTFVAVSATRTVWPMSLSVTT